LTRLSTYPAVLPYIDGATEIGVMTRVDVMFCYWYSLHLVLTVFQSVLQIIFHTHKESNIHPGLKF